jgi:hypothetical protein
MIPPWRVDAQIQTGAVGVQAGVELWNFLGRQALNEPCRAP